MELKTDNGGFLSAPIALALWWIALMSGIFSIARELVSLYWGYIPLRRVFGVAALIAFIVSAAMVWIDEHLKVIRLAKQFEVLRNELEPQFHFSINNFDPTTATGRARAVPGGEIELMATVINSGSEPLIIRGFVIRPDKAVGVLSNTQPLPVATGKKQQCSVPLQPFLDSLIVCDQLPREVAAQTWRGKVSIALWYEASGKTMQSPEQFFEAGIDHGKIVYCRQMTRGEFRYLTRATASVPE